MTKAEYIEKYGIEWYEEHKVKNRERIKERRHKEPGYRDTCNAKKREYQRVRYHNDVEWRESQNIKCRECHKERYCRSGELELIENYERAKADNFKDWDIHHRLEIHDDYINSKKDLIMMNLYYNRPAEELIFLTKSDHMKLHGGVN